MCVVCMYVRTFSLFELKNLFSRLNQFFFAIEESSALREDTVSTCKKMFWSHLVNQSL